MQLAGYEKVKDIQPGETREATVHVSDVPCPKQQSEELNVNADGTKDKMDTGNRREKDLCRIFFLTKLLMEKTR